MAKTKTTRPEQKRGRGRPRKNPPKEISEEILTQAVLNEEFFGSNFKGRDSIAGIQFNPKTKKIEYMLVSNRFESARWFTENSQQRLPITKTWKKLAEIIEEKAEKYIHNNRVQDNNIGPSSSPLSASLLEEEDDGPSDDFIKSILED